MLPCTNCRALASCSLRLYPVPGINLALEVQIYRLQPCDACAASGAACSNDGQLVYFADSPSLGGRGDSAGVGGGTLRYLLNPNLGTGEQVLEWQLMPTRVTLSAK